MVKTGRWITELALPKLHAVSRVEVPFSLDSEDPASLTAFAEQFGHCTMIAKLAILLLDKVEGHPELQHNNAKVFPEFDPD